MKKTPKYNFRSLEKKWQKKWQRDRIYQPDMDKAEKPFYNLMMFPYPSAEGLHVGSVYTFSGVDTYGRYKKLQGYDVFEPIGLDGFGIHSENFAMKIGQHILDVSKRTEKNFYRQLHEIGNMYDWSRTVETYKPNYYKWTQWLFLKMYERGLAYRKKAKVNWCPSCKTVLSDEQVISGRCERCDSEVGKKELAQWFFKITAYADRLLKNLDWIDWPEDVKTNQRNWIGKTEGIEIKYKIEELDEEVVCFTSYPETNYGATFVVLAPESPLALKITTKENLQKVTQYIDQAKKKSDIDRIAEGKKKTGAFTGRYCINNLTGYRMPIYVADFVLFNVGTGAVVGVPGHDLRDFQFAKEFDLEVVRVMKTYDGNESVIDTEEKVNHDGIIVNSEFLDGLDHKEARKKIMNYIEEKGWGKKTVTYKLRDWCISRQRYWGPPIPVVWCKHCAIEKQGIKAFMVHGAQKYEKADLAAANVRHWHEWLKKSLEIEGIKVFNPLMPENWQPDYEKWKSEFEKNKVSEQDIFIGHSVGCSFLVRYLSENKNVKISRLVLVAPTKFVPKEKENLKKFLDFEISNDVNDRIGRTIVVTSDNDLHDPGQESANYFVEALHAQKVLLQGMGHFMKKDMGTNRFPALLDIILKEIEPMPVPVAEKDLPVKLPPMEDFLPEGTGKGPLAKNEKFVKTKCPVCGHPAERETDVSDPFVDSSWYFFRYPSTEIDDQAFDKERTKKWLPVDSYIGGKEHTVLHLLYSRFVTMVLKDLGYIDFEEPYKRFFGHGLITKDGAKMSKSKGNVVNPDVMLEKYGADSVRLYLRFLGDFSQGGDWRDSGIEGMHRFVIRLWKTFHGLEGTGKGVAKTSIIDKTIKIVGQDIDRLSFNTAVARIMEFVNWIKENEKDFDEKQSAKIKETLAFVLAPMAPHLAEEFWAALGNTESIFTKIWPVYDENNIVEDEIEIVVQVNGKVRDKILMSKDVSEEDAKKAALDSEKIKQYLEGKEVRKVIYVKGRLISIVAG